MEPSRESLTDILRSSDVIRAAFAVSTDIGQKAYLVGGTVRDLLMTGALGNDYDFVVNGKVSTFARAFAEKVKGSFFVLDKERDTSRVVSKAGFQADFSAMRGTIEEDLRLRDFTINSIAIPLEAVFTGQWPGVSGILDPLGGMRDIEGKVLRMSSAVSIEEDPLRIMRGFRFSSAFGYSMDEELASHIKRQSALLERVSAERIRAELFMVLDMPGAYKTLCRMDEVGVLKTLFHEIDEWKGFYQGGWHAHDLFNHSMKTLEAMEEVLGNLYHYFPEYGDKINRHLGEEMEAYVTRRGLLKLASLLHDSGKFYTRTLEGDRYRFLGHEKAGEDVSIKISRRLRLSRRSEMMLRGLTGNHMRVLGLSMLKKITGRAKFRFFRDADNYGPDLLLLSLADAMATPVEGERLEEMKGLIRRLSDYYYEEFLAVQPRPLLTGEDIMKELGIPEGKKVGLMLEELREAELLGKVSNRREAIAFLKKLIQETSSLRSTKISN